MTLSTPAGLVLIAAAVVLASCADPARPAVPAPEVPVRPAPPSPPPAGSAPATGASSDRAPSTSAPSTSAPTASPSTTAAPAASAPVTAARLPTPVVEVPPASAPGVQPPAPTPQDQGTGEADTAITTALRTGILERKELSAEAHAIMVTTLDRVVTLRGSVADEPERDAVLSLVHAVPDVQRVDDQLQPIVR